MVRKVCAITGAAGGIGLNLAQAAVERGYDLILHGRSQIALEAAGKQLEFRTPDARITLVKGDLATAQGAKNVVADLSEVAPKLDLLINNAGVLLRGNPVSADGLDLHTQVNLIAPYILMLGLKPNVQTTSGTIVNVSSGAALRTKNLTVDSLRHPKAEANLFGVYAQSKLALAAITRALTPEYERAGITLVAADPGPTKTAMTTGDGMPSLLRFLSQVFYASAEKGAANIFRATEDAVSKKQSGAFYSKGHERELPAFATAETLVADILGFCAASATENSTDLPVSTTIANYTGAVQ